MEKVVPVLQIDDYALARSFYVDKLGFDIEFEWRHEPGFPVFMSIRKGALHLFLSEHGKGHQGTEMYIYVEDISEWHEICMLNGIEIDSGPDEKPWGNTEMFVIDPHRNGLRITQVETHEPTATSA